MSPNKNLRNLVIVGAAASGLRAAETLRAVGFTGSLTLVGEEIHPPYMRPPLSKHVLSGEWPENKTFFKGGLGSPAIDATWRLGVSAVGIDRSNRRVLLSDSTSLNYDGLVVATGVSPRRLSQGHELEGVHVLRTLDDARRLGGALVAGRRLVIVGAGFLGCEVAAVAVQAGMSVSLVDPLEGPMVRQLGPEIAGHIERLHRTRGVELYLKNSVAGLHGSQGQVMALELDDGTLVAADVVLVAIGSTPNVAWLQGNGLSLTDGVDCDEFCRASAEIVAAGDVASWEHPLFGRRMRVEHHTNALEQGSAAARALHGDVVEPFAPIPYFWSDQYDVKLQVHGSPHPSSTTSVVRGDPAEGRFALAYRFEGRLTAVLTWNLPREALKLREELVADLASR